MRKILVLNLTRFGDLLQTSPTISGLKALHPAAEVTVCVDRNFAEVCRGLPGVDRVWEIELDRLGRLILADDLRAAYREVETLVAALRAERFELAINYSSSRMSAVLMRLVGVADTRGWTMTADGHRLITHRWSRLFSASALTRRQGAFNLVDYYKRVAGVTAGPRRLLFAVPAAARERAARLLGEAGHAGDPLVALQLGASRVVRRWPAPSFIALARELDARLGARVLLCGGSGEQAVAAEVAAALGTRAIDACGRTSIAELGALLERADVLVTSDTGPMHLAVAVGTPVVALFFGPALPADTGPYAADQVCLHADVPCAPCDHNVNCLDPFCRETLAPAAVAEAVVARRAADWSALGVAADRWTGLGWYRTGFDAEGVFDLERLGARAPGERERLRRAYRTLWKAVLDGTPPARGAGPALPGVARVVRELAARAAEGSALAREVEALVARGDLAALERAARRLEALDAGVIRFGAIHEPVTLLVQMFRFERESLEGDDVAALAAATRRMHEDLETWARLLADLLDPVREAVPASEGRQHARVA
ncbi:MAG TPA: glycosyltransferase family 9 protein [Candidatus Binatus sp.]|nr:glycosyltransferase family 9 protein [Candidatus Binatus sp.]